MSLQTDHFKRSPGQYLHEVYGKNLQDVNGKGHFTDSNKTFKYMTVF